MTDLPHNVPLEQQILGAILLNNELYHRVSGRIEARYFYEPVHQDIWKNISGRIERDHTASPVTLKVDFETHAGMKELGGVAYLARIAGYSVMPSMVPSYADELAMVYQRRTLVEALQGSLDALGQGQEVSTTKDGLELVLTSLTGEDGKENSVSMMSAVTSTIKEIDSAYHGKGAGLMTGIAALDEKMGGLWPADLIILAGRPSMGKTATAIEIGRRVAKTGTPVAVVSLEMTEQSIAQRLISSISSVNYSDTRKGKMSEKEYRRVVDGAKEIAELPFSIVPPHVREVASIFSALKKEKSRMGGLGLVIVDYLQLVRARGNGRTEMMTEVSIQLKNMAKLLNVPVIALSQLSRQVETRDNKRPVLSDLRESGQIEQDADAVIFCYRDHYYLSRETPPTKMEERADYEAVMTKTKNEMELIIAKQRMGDITTVKVGCHLPTNRFWDLDSQNEIAF